MTLADRFPAILRAGLLGRPRLEELAVGPGEAVGLAGLLALVAAMGDWLSTAAPRELSLGGLEYTSVFVLLLGGLAWLGARQSRRPALLLPLWVGLLALECWVYAGASLSESALHLAGASGRGFAAALAVSLWLCAAGLRMRLLDLGTGLGTLRSIGLGALHSAAAVYLAFQLPGPRSFFYTDYEATPERSAAAAPAPVDVEALLHAQPGRVAAALDGLQSQRPGVPDLYLVAFGADATQRVFAREVAAVQSLFDEQLDTERRSIVLVNDPRHPDAHPIASASNLQDVLIGLGQVLDPRQDVLFLYLTGHGSKQGHLAVRFPPLPLDDLDADRLAAMLERSGLGARVVVVSACYAGSFVAPLHSDWTVVMTAAAADRSSFGCSDEADFTYFGRALFAEALPSGLTFPAAFQAARASVAAREAREKKTPSLPQYEAGRKALARLARLDARLGLHDAPPAMAAAEPAAHAKGRGTKP